MVWALVLCPDGATPLKTQGLPKCIPGRGDLIIVRAVFSKVKCGKVGQVFFVFSLFAVSGEWRWTQF